MLRCLMAFGVAVSFAGAASAQSAPKINEKALKAAMETKLKDAESARFRGITYYPKSDGMWVMCGEVNAKNSMGGYAGFEPFLALAVRDDSKPPRMGYLGVRVGDVAGVMCDEKAAGG